jgi:hypothetical protein
MDRSSLFPRLNDAVRLLVICAVLASSALWVQPAGAESAAISKGKVGGPPTIPLGKPDEGERTTPDLVIGRGRDFGGPVELVAYGWRSSGLGEAPQEGVCLWAEYISRHLVNFQSCLLTDESRPGGVIEINTGTQQVQPKNSRWTQIGGWLSPEVSAVRVSFHRPGRDGSFRAAAVVARVNGELQRMLKLPEPIGYYTVRVRGLLPRRLFTVQPVLEAGRLAAGVRNQVHALP